MSNNRASAASGALDGHEHGVGFLVLALAQFVSIFGFWLGYYPAAFRLPEGTLLSGGLAGFFLAAGAVGFYLAFSYLTME